jgi:hypothetical protein
MSTALQLDAFASTTKHHLEITVLAPIALELARQSGSVGVTVADLRAEAERRKLLPARNQRDRSLSYLGAVMKAAGLRATDRTRRSFIPQSNGNRQTVWIAP